MKTPPRSVTDGDIDRCRGDWPNLDALLAATARDIAAEDEAWEAGPPPLRCADHPDAAVVSVPNIPGKQCTTCRRYVCIRCRKPGASWAGRCDDCERAIYRQQDQSRTETAAAEYRTRVNAVRAAVFLEQENAMLAAAVRDAAEALEDAEEHRPFSSTVHEQNVDRARGILNGALARLDGAL